LDKSRKKTIYLQSKLKTMPIDPLTIAATSGAVNTILQPAMTAITNRQNRKYALEDWNRQNAYNHPAQQMQRLKEAGLNPNLVYGSGATTIAQPVRSPEQQVPNIDLQKVPETIMQYQGIKNQQLEYSRIQKAMELQEAQKKNIEANTLSTLAGTDLKKLDITSKSIMNEFLPEVQEANLLKTKVQTGVAVSQNEMEKLMFPNKVDKVLAEIGNIKARTEMIPTQKQQLLENIKNIKQKMHYFGLTESQKLETGKILQESALLKNLMQGKQIKGQDLQNQLMEIKKGFKDKGLSETQTSDLIKQLLSIVDFF
jgi:hypothetical protein